MDIVKLPSILPGDLNLVELSKKLREHSVQLDWSAVISAPELQLAILLKGVDQVNDIDWLVCGDIADNIAADIFNFFNKPKSSNTGYKTKKSSEKKKPTEAQKKPQVWERGNPYENEFAPVEVSETIPEEVYVPENTVNSQLQPPTPYELRAKLEETVLADLLGPSGGENEEVDEDSISDRYLVGLIAPQQRRKNTVSTNQESDIFREVDCQQPEYLDDLAVAGKGSVEDGTTEISVPPAQDNVSLFLWDDFLCKRTSKSAGGAC